MHSPAMYAVVVGVVLVVAGVALVQGLVRASRDHTDPLHRGTSRAREVRGHRTD